MEKILLISPSTFDKKTWIVSMIGMLALLFLGWLEFFIIPANQLVSNIIFVSIIILISGLFVLDFICTPYKYILTNSELIIKRYLKDIVIPLQSVKSIRLMDSAERKGMRCKNNGASGCFGLWGHWKTLAHKKLFIYVRRWNNWTLIETDKEKYVIAPDDLQLIDATMQEIGQTKTDSQLFEIQENRWRKIIPAAIVVAVTFLVYMGFKEPRFVSDSNVFKLKGLYGVNILFAEISEADTITWREMPAISIRTNGISLFKVKRGKFRTSDGEKIRLSVNSGSNPIIRMVNRGGDVYYVNRKNEAETRQIYNKLQEKIKQ